jgi:hypothetical protein
MDEPSLKELWERREPLIPELAACVVDTPGLGLPFIKHKYVNTLYFDGANAMHNHAYEVKVKLVAEARAERKWHSFLFLHERPWRFEALVEIADEMDNVEFWEAVSDVWMDSENIRENYEEWDNLLRSDRPGRENMMNDEEREALAAMADEFFIYQGHTDERDDGWSWTTSQKTAEWFGRRFANLEGGLPLMTKARVQRRDVTAYLSGRGEAEILVDPFKVEIVGTTEL